MRRLGGSRKRSHWRHGIAMLCFAAVLAAACGDADDDTGDSDPGPAPERSSPLERVLPVVDADAVRRVAVLDVAEVAATVAAEVGRPEHEVSAFLVIDGVGELGAVDVANAVITGLTCLEEQGKLEFAFHQDREHPQSVGIFFAADLEALRQFDSLVCAFEALLELIVPLDGGVYRLPGPLPEAPRLEPCFEAFQQDGVQVVYVASTDWMCEAFAGTPPTVPCVDGSRVHPRDDCEAAVTVSIGATSGAVQVMDHLITGFDRRYRGTSWHSTTSDAAALCVGSLDLLITARPLRDEEAEICEANGLDLAGVVIADHWVYVTGAPPDTLFDYLRSERSRNDVLAQLS